MARGQPAVLHRLAHALIQREQAHGVGDGGARLADRRGGVLLRHVIGLNERFVALGLFNGVQILALQVFNERQLHCLAVVRLDDDGGHLRQTGKPRSPPAAFAGNDLIVARGELAHGQGLNDAVFADGVRQIGERGVVKMLARLTGAALHLRNGEVEAVGAFGLQGGVAEQRAKPSAEPAVCVCHENSPFCRGAMIGTARASRPRLSF